MGREKKKGKKKEKRHGEFIRRDSVDSNIELKGREARRRPSTLRRNHGANKGGKKKKKKEEKRKKKNERRKT